MMQSNLFKSIGAAVTLAASTLPALADDYENARANFSSTYYPTNRIADAYHFTQAMRIPKKFESPSLDQFLSKKSDLAATTLSELINSDIWDREGFIKEFGKVDKQDRLAALAGWDGARLCALLKWIYVNKSEVDNYSKLESWNHRYEERFHYDIQFSPEEMSEIAKLKQWDTKFELKKAQKLYLEIPGLPRIQAFSQDEITSAREAVLRSTFGPWIARYAIYANWEETGNRDLFKEKFRLAFDTYKEKQAKAEAAMQPSLKHRLDEWVDRKIETSAPFVWFGGIAAGIAGAWYFIFRAAIDNFKPKPKDSLLYKDWSKRD